MCRGNSDERFETHVVIRLERPISAAERVAAKTILVVEDETPIATIIHDVLVDEGYQVHIASNGRAALERIAMGMPDLVLTDIMMPIMDGRALLRALRTIPPLESLPVILMSAGAAPRANIAEQSSEFLAKPFLIDDLIALVQRLIGPPTTSSD